jgi:hypothetical protein
MSSATACQGYFELIYIDENTTEPIELLCSADPCPGHTV